MRHDTEVRSVEAGAPGDLFDRTRVPELPSGVVNRSRLFHRLGEATAYPITTVTGPAGWGKTQLLTSWVRSPECSLSCAWLTVEHSDTDPRLFWPAVMSAVARARTRDRAAGGAVDSVAPVVEALLAIEEPLLLVLDDVHLFERSAVESELVRLVQHLPPQVRLVLSGRYLPTLPMARLRVEHKVYALTGKDLAFTFGESAAMLAESGVDIPEQVASVLCERTEGWSAGLRLAALSLLDGLPAEDLLHEFGGEHMEVAEYLMAEVLSRLPPDVEDFLLKTSICGRLTGDLAAELTGRDDSMELLRWMARHNLFTTAENPRQVWFRYHPMLGELLRSRLDRLGSNAVRKLHRSASSWYAAHDMPSEAFDHAVRAEDWAPAENLLGDRWLSMYLDGKLMTLRELIDRLPAERVAGSELADVRTAVGLALGDGNHNTTDSALTGAGFDSYTGPAAVPVTQRMEAAAHEPAKPAGIEKLIDEAGTESPSSAPALVVALERARLAGDLVAAVCIARRLIALSESDEYRGSATASDLQALALQQLGVTEFWAGRRTDSEAHLREALSVALDNGRAYVQLGCRGQLVGVLTPQNRITDALREADDALTLVREHGWEFTGAAAELWHALGWAAYMRGDLDLAEQYLDGASVAVRRQDAAVSTTVLLVRGLIVGLKGRKRDALAMLESAAQVMARLRARYVFADYLLVERARLRLAIGDVAEARALLEEYPDDPGGPVHLTIAKAELLASDGQPEPAIQLLDPAIRIGQGLTDQRLQAIVLLALLQLQGGNEQAAVTTAAEAIQVAAPEQLVQPFLQFGKPVARLLSAAERNGSPHRDFTDLIRARATSLWPVNAGPQLHAGGVDVEEPPTERELEVLQALDGLATLPEISAAMFVSVNTLKSHLRSLYRKLGVGSRRGAVERGRSLGLL
ncbi:LuxR family maltose regulon positive regulatory protein [Halopolyspora algeriensis]|uniref:LuxR family maltose regulon positive regulatory protein n=1 Tax=Halopolyspora algeriensis TaxID=1500506 RepID=A0A368VUU9_9ACTN|nr:LuxR C-terminal-related transcriptional regulator [Halopolyspora algeriensis]RCW45874.1 LuxR family maltose regulon positive regulatory protein [Halopolyspora algeriensis]TQM55288.1 LuxR family maltose regulon positive regulatory protein [Halopolyspora algeriensis]